MKRFFVSFDVLSKSRTLDQLRALLDLQGSEDSFDRDDCDPLLRKRQESMLRIVAPAADAPVNAQISSLRSFIESAATRLSGASSVDIVAVLNIAVFFDTADGSLEFSSALLDGIQLPFEISISAYPVSRVDTTGGDRFSGGADGDVS